MANTTRIITPSARVIIWNYDSRMATNSLPVGRDPDATAERLDIVDEIYSIKTTKTKAAAAGQFEIMLAPTQNWISRITTGSWLAILAATSPIPKSETETADRKSLKMLGRVDSVRVSSSVDQSTGARSTYFIVTGRDWGGLFDNTLYIDQLATTGSALNATQLLSYFANDDINSSMKKSVMKSTTEAVDLIIGIMGNSKNDAPGTNVILNPTAAVSLPTEVAEFMGSGGLFSKPGDNIADKIVLKTGKLTDYDTYEDIYESSVPMYSQFIIGEHTWWQLINYFSNPILNEVITELSWKKPGETDYKQKQSASPFNEEFGALEPANVPKMTVYKRIRPFTTSGDNLLVFIAEDPKGIADVTTVSQLISPFHNVATFDIDESDIIAINAGTNWLNKCNFLEIMPADSGAIADNSIIPNNKTNAQIWDQEAVKREGLRPWIRSSYCYGPVVSGTLDSNGGSAIETVIKWKYLLKDWYFNTHNMLDGTVSIVGQNDYIQVGGNIRVPIATIDPSQDTFNSAQLESLTGPQYLLAHIEAVSHEITTQAGGGVTFVTHVTFVRGILAGSDNKPLSDNMPMAGVILEDNLTSPGMLMSDFENPRIILNKPEQ